MMLEFDSEKARNVAPILYREFLIKGIHGKKDMPEDIPPENVTIGSREHILFLTLTVSIDYQRDAHVLWDCARRTYADPETRYLFEPESIANQSLDTMIRDLQRYKLSKKPRKDAWIWRTVALSFNKKWKNDPRLFLADCNWDAVIILHRLKNDTHFTGKTMAWDFPYLRGPKIGSLWVKMLRDNARIEDIVNLEKVPIPVDVHVARATLALGVVKGRYQGSLNVVYDAIRGAWKQGVLGVSTGKYPMIPLDVDEPLWHLSKFGCRNRDTITGECPLKMVCVMREYCVDGRLRIGKDGVILETA